MTQSLFGVNICGPDSLLLLDGLLCGDLNSFILVHSRIIRSPFKTWITLKVNESPHSIRGRERNSWKLDHGCCSGAFHDLLRSTASYLSFTHSTVFLFLHDVSDSLPFKSGLAAKRIKHGFFPPFMDIKILRDQFFLEELVLMSSET